MNILLVDNGTSHLNELVRVLRGHKITVVVWGEFSSGQADTADLVMLSGGHSLTVLDHDREYREELALIRTSVKPIIGICLGYELIAHAFGSKLGCLENKESGLIPIELLRPHPFFLNVIDPQVYEAHRWVVSEVRSPLVPLARSKDGYEIIAHQDRPIYGFQFHPEMCVDAAMGDEILGNCLTFIENSI